jgi:uncharacterized protein (TIGR00251 family)
MAWLRVTEAGVEVDLWVVPGANRTAVVGLHGDALRIRVAAPPAAGAANRVVMSLLERTTGGSVTLVRGGRSRRKTVLITGVGVETVRAALRPDSP